MLDGVVFKFFDFCFGNRQNNVSVLTFIFIFLQEFRIGAGNKAVSLRPDFSIDEADTQLMIFNLNSTILQLFFTQTVTEFFTVIGDFTFNVIIHIHFHQEVHTTAQIQTQRHRARAHIEQPVGGGRRQVQCHNEFITQQTLYGVFCRQLIFVAGQAKQCRTTGHFFTKKFDIAFLQSRTDFSQYRFRHFSARTGRRYLNSSIGRIQVGCGIKTGKNQRQHNEKVFPQRVFIEHTTALILIQKTKTAS